MSHSRKDIVSFGLFLKFELDNLSAVRMVYKFLFLNIKKQ